MTQEIDIEKYHQLSQKQKNRKGIGESQGKAT